MRPAARTRPDGSSMGRGLSELPCVPPRPSVRSTLNLTDPRDFVRCKVAGGRTDDDQVIDDVRVTLRHPITAICRSPSIARIGKITSRGRCARISSSLVTSCCPGCLPVFDRNRAGDTRAAEREISGVRGGRRCGAKLRRLLRRGILRSRIRVRCRDGLQHHAVVDETRHAKFV